MTTIVSGIVTNGVIVPNSPLPEGTEVEIHLTKMLKIPTDLQVELAAWQQGNAEALSLVESSADEMEARPRLTPSELRKLPRAERQAVLAAAASLAEEDYRNDKELTGFEAFSEEEFDADESHQG